MADRDNCQVVTSGRAWKAARSRAVKNGSEVRSDGTLDARIWGRLQEYISLRKVHEKLTSKDFFRLSVVSKAWHQAALERLEPEPYFVTLASGPHCRYLNGILSYDVASDKFTWNRQHYVIEDASRDPLLAPFEVEGLIWSPDPKERRIDAVCDLHSKTWHQVPTPMAYPRSTSHLINGATWHVV